MCLDLIQFYVKPQPNKLYLQFYVKLQPTKLYLQFYVKPHRDSSSLSLQTI